MIAQLFRVAGALVLVSASAVLSNTDSALHKSAHEIGVNYRVVPAEVVQAHVTTDKAERMHGNQTGNRNPPPDSRFVGR